MSREMAIKDEDVCWHTNGGVWCMGCGKCVCDAVVQRGNVHNWVKMAETTEVDVDRVW